MRRLADALLDLAWRIRMHAQSSPEYLLSYVCFRMSAFVGLLPSSSCGFTQRPGAEFRASELLLTHTHLDLIIRAHRKFCLCQRSALCSSLWSRFCQPTVPSLRERSTFQSIYVECRVSGKLTVSTSGMLRRGLFAAAVGAPLNAAANARGHDPCTLSFKLLAV